jgi:GNAT superfamily N-acetyltransferase
MTTKPSYYFDSKFKQDLKWRDKFNIRVGSVLPNNKEQISKSLRDMSAESIRNRFLGSKKEFSVAELEYLSNLDGTNHYAIGIEEREKPFRGIAIARMVRTASETPEAEIAITIIDDYQALGMGTVLMKMMVLAAAERSVERLSFTFLPQNEGIIKLINKIGSVTKASKAMDYVQYCIDLKQVDLEKIKSQLAPYLPTIDTFRLKI